MFPQELLRVRESKLWKKLTWQMSTRKNKPAGSIQLKNIASESLGESLVYISCVWKWMCFSHQDSHPPSQFHYTDNIRSSGIPKQEVQSCSRGENTGATELRALFSLSSQPLWISIFSYVSSQPLLLNWENHLSTSSFSSHRKQSIKALAAL